MKANVIYIISGRDYRRAVAVQYDENEDILNDNREGVDIDTENVDDMYIVCDEEKAKKAVELFNENTEQDMSEIIKNMEEINMETSMNNKLTFNGKSVQVPEAHIKFAENLMEQEMFDKNDMLVVLPAKKYNTESEKRVDEMEDIEKGMIRSEVVNFENSLNRFRKVVARVFGKDSDETYNFTIASRYLRHSMRILSDVAFEVDSESDLFDLMENDD